MPPPGDRPLRPGLGPPRLGPWPLQPWPPWPLQPGPPWPLGGGGGGGGGVSQPPAPYPGWPVVGRSSGDGGVPPVIGPPRDPGRPGEPALVQDERCPVALDPSEAVKLEGPAGGGQHANRP